MYVNVYMFMCVCLSPCTLHFSLELIVTEPHTPASICGCHVARVCVDLWQGMCEAEGQMFNCRTLMNTLLPVQRSSWESLSLFLYVRDGASLGRDSLGSSGQI